MTTEMSTGEVHFASLGATLYGFHWPAAPGTSATVLMCHGLTNHHADAPMFELLRDLFLAQGLGVFMFDFFGSGKSDGEFKDKTWSTMRQNVADALDVVEGLGASSIPLVGRSVGASVAGFFARDPRVNCTVLASPVFRLRYQFEPYRSPAVDGLVTMPESVERSGQIKGAWRLNEEFFDELEQTERELADAIRGAQRVLITHGLGDPKVEVRHSTELLELLAEPKRYIGVEGGNHYYAGREVDVAQAALAWVTQYTTAEVR